MRLALAAVLLALAPLASAADDVGGLDVYAEGGAVHLLVGRRGDEAPSVEYLRSDDSGGTWSGPVAVSKGLPAPYRVETGDVQLAASGKTVLAVWSAKGPGPMGSGPIVAARSEDSGKTWTRVASPAGADLKQGMRFVDLAADASGFHAVWLDRKAAAQLLYARSTDAGRTWTKPKVLDADACECCWNTLADRDGKLLALYRAKDPRDMALFSSPDAGKSWSARAVVGPFGWNANMCPHVGGALASAGARTHALVWTGKTEELGLHHLASEDGGKTWSKPARLGDATARHSDLAASADGALAAVWDAKRGKDAVVLVSYSKDGASWTEPQALAAKAAYPRVVSTPAGFRFFWLEKDGERSRWASRAR